MYPCSSMLEIDTMPSIRTGSQPALSSVCTEGMLGLRSLVALLLTVRG